jgi:hypothetical protein
VIPDGISEKTILERNAEDAVTLLDLVVRCH